MNSSTSLSAVDALSTSKTEVLTQNTTLSLIMALNTIAAATGNNLVETTPVDLGNKALNKASKQHQKIKGANGKIIWAANPKFNPNAVSERKQRRLQRLKSKLDKPYKVLSTASAFEIISYKEVKHDTSQPLQKNVRPVQVFSNKAAEENREIKKSSTFSKNASSEIIDTVMQSKPGQAAILEPILSFSGSTAADRFNLFAGGRPDTNGGAVGDTQYVQTVYDSISIYDKSSGMLQLGPVSYSKFWNGFSPCDNQWMADPVLLFDKLAHRWVVFAASDAWDNDRNPLQPEDKDNWERFCIAVSSTADARGPYHRYLFKVLDGDFGKLGIWPDGYYVTNLGGPNFEGAHPDKGDGVTNACAVERDKMLLGEAATMQCANIKTRGYDDPSSRFISNPLPSDFDGPPPPSGTPNYFGILYYDKQIVEFYPFHVNWNNPEKSYIETPLQVSVAPFGDTASVCRSPYDRGCIPQPNTTVQIDSGTNFSFIYRLAYRYLGNNTANILMNHNVLGAYNNTAMRWYQVKIDQQQQFSILQQSTFTPDSTSRWAGSVAMDKMGNIAMGYSASSSTDIYPGIRIAGRLASDALGQLREEQTIKDGDTITTTGGPSDYSGMTIDPLDDCTFWYTNFYITKAVTSSLKHSSLFRATQGVEDYPWATQISSFKFPGCK